MNRKHFILCALFAISQITHAQINGTNIINAANGASAGAVGIGASLGALLSSHNKGTAARAFCEEIKMAFNDPNHQRRGFCEEISKHYRENGSIILANCEVTAQRLLNQDTEAITACEREMKNIDLVPTELDPTRSERTLPPRAIAQNNDLVNVHTMAHESQTISKDASLALNSCQPSEGDFFSCSVTDNLFSEGFLDLMVKIPPKNENVTRQEVKYDTKTCNCFEKQARSFLTMNGKETKVDEEIAKEKEKVNAAILEAASKKALNEFAANMEDVTFFKTNKGSMLGGDEKSNELLCIDGEKYLQRIKSACDAANISPTERANRSEALISALGPVAGTNIGEKFRQLQADILDTKFDNEGTHNQTDTFSRESYDKYRFGNYKNRIEVKFLSDFTTELMMNDKLGPKLKDEIGQGKNPTWAIMSLLKDESNNDVKSILQKLYRQNRTSRFYKSIKSTLETSTNDLGNFVSEKINEALEMNPGLKALYKEPLLFSQIVSRSLAQKKSIIDTLENDTTELSKYFEKRCDKIIDSFAETVCTPRSELIGKARQSDLSALLSIGNSNFNPNLRDMILCQMGEDGERTDSTFQRLVYQPWQEKEISDYWKRKDPNSKMALNTGLSEYDLMKKAYNKGDTEVQEYINRISSSGEQFREPTKDYARVAIDGAKESTEVAANAVTPNNTLEFFNQVAKANETMASPAPMNENYVSNLASSAVKTRPEERSSSEEDPRSLLRDFLASESSKEEVDKHLSNINQADQEELLRLQNEITRNREEMQKLATELEKKKVQRLEEEVQNLEQKYVQTTQEAPSPQAVENDYRATTAGSNHGVRREIASINNSAGSSSGQESGGPTSSGSVASLGSPSSINAAGLRGLFDTSSTSSSTSGTIVIESSLVRSGDQQLSKDSLSQEVISYVKNNSLDVSTLQKLIDDGLILKIKVVKNGVEVQEEVKVDPNVLNQDAKRFLEGQIALQKYNQAKRAYSFSTLKLLLGIKAQNTVN